MDSIQVRARIRTLRETGDIPCDPPDRLWAGRGQGRPCAACSATISMDQVEYEVDLRTGITIRLHRDCHAVWLQECAERAQ